MLSLDFKKHTDATGNKTKNAGGKSWGKLQSGACEWVGGWLEPRLIGYS